MTDKNNVKESCPSCKRLVTKKTRGIACNLCDNWYHPTCQNVSDAVLAAVEEDSKTEKPGLHWYCNICSTGADKILGMMSGLTATQKVMNQTLTQHGTRIENIEKQNIEQATEIDTWQNREMSFELESSKRLDKLEEVIKEHESKIATNIARLDVVPETTTSNQSDWPSARAASNQPIKFITRRDDPVVSEVTKLVNDRLERQSNIMIFNIRESNDNLKEDVLRNDKLLVTELCRFVVGEDLRFSTQRLGGREKKEANGEHGSEQENANVSNGRKQRDISGEIFEPRPLRVTFSDLDSKIKVMRGLHKLGEDDVPDELLSISVKHDLTGEERKKEKKLRMTVKEKNAQNQEKNVKFVVTGPPWERHMGTMEKRGTRWVFLRNSQTREVLENIPMPALEETEPTEVEAGSLLRE